VFHPTTTSATTLFAFLLGSSVAAQPTLSEDALRASGAIPTVSLPDSAVSDSVKAPSVAGPDSAASRTSAPAVAPASASSEGVRANRFSVLVGVTDWHWEEELDKEIVLVEGGLIPSLRIEYAVQRDMNEFGASFNTSYGAIEYDGALQSEEGLTDFKSNTHYFDMTAEGFAFFSNLVGSLPIKPGVKVGYHRWVRTIGSKDYQEPGEYGYVETWSHMSLQPAMIVEIPFGSSNLVRLEGGIRIPFSTTNTISKLEYTGLDAYGDTVTVKVPENSVKPKTKTGFRARAQVKIHHLLAEVEYLALDFNKSSANKYGFLQPTSYLDRLDARVGLEF